MSAARPAVQPLPTGFRVRVDPDTRQLDDCTLFGGSPGRVMRLSGAGMRAWQQLRDGPISTVEAGLLARRLTDAGLVHPVPPRLPDRPDVTVLIPVRDRQAMLERCLAAVGRSHPVVVVDDGSADPAATAELARRHGARVIRRERSGGPGRARNAGLAEIATEFVAFLDSDCIPPPDWLTQLTAHLADPLVAAVAPRIVALHSDTAAGRYSATRGSLDLGDSAGRVVPGTRVSYVPTAALVVRRSALAEVSTAGPVFDPALRYGEDVDLIWRLHEADWRIRFVPEVQVHHQEPDRWVALLRRRFSYGTSAAPLAARHPRSIAPLVLHPWSAGAVAALLARRPLIAGACFAGSVLTLRRTLVRADIPTDGVLPPMINAARQTWLGAGRYGTQFAAPALAAMLLAPSRKSRSWHRRGVRQLAAASLLLGPPVTAWQAGRPDLDIARYVAAQIADDIGYGSGVWAGCLRHRQFRALLPRVAWRPLTITARPPDG